MKLWLDRTTGAVTMYKLILIVLAALSALAFILSAVGLVGQAPLALLASLPVAVVSTCGGSFLAARIARVEPHLESALISALLVFFIMKPTFDPLGLAGVALAGVVAGLSKYVLAWRGRHLFNPAAIGTLVPTTIVLGVLTAGGPIIGLSYGTWWVGTPWMQPLVYLGAFLVLYRTQRLALGGFFIALTLVLASTVAIIGGQDAGAAIAQAALQSPIVFFAGFMLSEPLTLPPRRRQQFLEAVVVSVLFAVPIPLLGPLSHKPAFALVVGNLIGFAFGQRRGIRLTYEGKHPLGEGTWELRFQPDRRVRFLPGQYLELTIPHRRADFRGSRRYFSIASAPTAAGPITIAITVPEKSSSFKRALLDLEPGQLVVATGVHGDFALPADASTPLLLVAGGIGITPFASQLAHAVDRGEDRDVTIVYQTSTPGELPYRALLEQSGARVVLFAPDAPDPLPEHWVYAGPGRVSGDRLAELVPDAARRRAFVSGPPGLVADLRRALRALGTRRIHTDYFSGY